MNKPINLQFFAEDDEAQVDTPVENAESTENVESNVDESQTDTQEDTTPDYTDFLSAINEKAVYKGGKLPEESQFKSFDDVIEAAQMRTNYKPTHDRMTKAEARVNELENSAQRKFMNKFLKDAGYENFETYETALEVDKLVKEGMTEERAMEHVKGQRSLRADASAKEKATLEAQKENIDSENNADAIDWYKDKGYGDLTAENVEQRTWDKVNKGLPLKYALMEQMFDTVKGDTEQDVLKKLQNKKDSSMGSVTSTGEKQTESFSNMSDAKFEAIQEQVKNGTYKKSFKR